MDTTGEKASAVTKKAPKSRLEHVTRDFSSRGKTF